MRDWGRARSVLRTGFSAVFLASAPIVPSNAAAISGACKGARLALVIGNKSYPDSEVPLKGPVEGATRVADALRALGFDVQVGEDMTKAKMDAAVRALEAKIKPGAGVFLYFSGLGLQAAGHTYLLPVDASIWSEGDIAANGVNIDRVLGDIEDKKAAVAVLVVDAARRNPFERRFRASGSAGLAPPSAISGNLVALFSAPPGKVFDAADLKAEPFADDVARELSAPHATAQEAFRQVRAIVARTSKAGQTPWGFSTLSDDLPLDMHDCSNSPDQVASSSASQAVKPESQAAKAEPQVTKVEPQVAKPEPQVAKADPQVAKPEPQSARAAPPASRDSLGGAIGPPPAPAPPPTAKLDPAAPSPSPAAPPEDRFQTVLRDTALLDETRNLLYEQNLDPGAVGSDTMRESIHTFEQQAGLPDVPQPTQGLLDSLRATRSLSPWGAIAVAQDVKSWGMSWDKPTRALAEAEAKTRCGKKGCTQDMTFYGQGCGAFALSPRQWIVAHRDGGDAARKAAVSDCSKGGAACRVVGSVCANGSDKTD